ncbi:MAG: prepilin-type N-terminal cleavage/methylation domain-containing protein [Deltaproteobacteria bacterium]|nr:prepilin-type N-terminal cleavage/methylation domain-containing protein [Deltaproteobacteria bacterium]
MILAHTHLCPAHHSDGFPAAPGQLCDEVLQFRARAPGRLGFLARRARGFTLVELLVAMATGMVVLAAGINIVILHKHAYQVQDQCAEMVQTARAALDMMSREVRMAGFDPTGAGFKGLALNPSRLCIHADLSGPNPDDPPDGDTDDPNECIVYRYDPEHLQIDRNTGGGYQPFAENIVSFTFGYLNKKGSSAQTTADIRQVWLHITARTRRPDFRRSPGGGYRTYTLSALITPVNLGCSKP